MQYTRRVQRWRPSVRFANSGLVVIVIAAMAKLVDREREVTQVPSHIPRIAARRCCIRSSSAERPTSCGAGCRGAGAQRRSGAPYGCSPPRDVVASLAIAYATLVAAHRTPLSWRRMTRRGDFSYGLCIWGWMVQQVAVTAIPGLTPMTMFCVSLPVAYLLGGCSW